MSREFCWDSPRGISSDFQLQQYFCCGFTSGTFRNISQVIDYYGLLALVASLSTLGLCLLPMLFLEEVRHRSHNLPGASHWEFKELTWRTCCISVDSFTLFLELLCNKKAVRHRGRWRQKLAFPENRNSKEFSLPFFTSLWGRWVGGRGGGEGSSLLKSPTSLGWGRIRLPTHWLLILR